MSKKAKKFFCIKFVDFQQNKCREDSLQNAKQCLPDCFYLYEITAALLQSIFKNFLNQLCNTVVII